MRRGLGRCAAGVLLGVLAACGSSASKPAVVPRSVPSTTSSTVAPTSTTTTVPYETSPIVTQPRGRIVTTPSAAPAAAFSSSVSPVTATALGASWHPGCPVGPDELRRVDVAYWGFDGQRHPGTLIVNASVVDAVITVFAHLYDARFPIRQMVPVSAYGGNDDASMAADNTSAFNCRFVAGTTNWSAHAYGEAVDVNTVENPYVQGDTVSPPAGNAYMDRGDIRPGMASWGGTLVDAFASVGWQWGGRWSDPDYQHFSSTGG